MSYFKFQFGQPQYVQFDQNMTIDDIWLVGNKMNVELIEGEVENPTVKVSFKYFETDKWIIPQNSFSISSTETDKLRFNIQYMFYPQLLPKLIMNCIAASMMLRREMLLIHGMLLSTGEVLYGQPYSGKTTLAKQLKTALCDDQVLVDLKNKIAYPIPYFFIDFSSPFFNDPVTIKPVELKSIKPINSSQDLYRCSTMFLYQPFAERDEVFNCSDEKKWCSFEAGFEDRMKQRIQFILKNSNFS